MMVRLSTDEAHALQAVAMGQVRVVDAIRAWGMPPGVSAHALDSLRRNGYVTPGAGDLVVLTPAGEAISTPGIREHVRPVGAAPTSGTFREDGGA